MSYAMLAKMGVAIIEGYSDYTVARVESSIATAAHAHRNYMAAVAASQAINTTNLNEIEARDANVRLQETLQRQALVDQGAAAVASGSQAGQSVAAVMRGFTQTAARANYARTEQLKGQLRQFGQERRNVRLSQVLSRDTTVVPKPSAASFAVGLGAKLLDIHDKDQPESERMTLDKAFDVFSGMTSGRKSTLAKSSGIE